MSELSDTLPTSSGSAARSWGAFVLIFLALIVEGFDLQVANFASPAIEGAFHLTRAQLGPLQSASLVGVLIGAVFIGPLGDRVGRRTILISCCVVYGLLSLTASFATSLTQLILLRLLIGIGLGGVLPNALALAGEFAPRRHLATATGLVGIGITFGGVVAGAVAANFLPTYGWPSLFIAGGILPITIALLLWIALPESPALKLDKTQQRHTSGVQAVLAPEFRARTIAIWCIFPLVLMVVYLLSGWIPLLVKDQGYSLATTSWIATTSHIGGVAGGVTASLLLSRGHWKIVALFAALSVVSLAILAAHDWSMGMLITLLLLVGFFSTGTQNGLNGSASATYPAAIRASGLGWALGLGRVGSILGPLAGSLAIIIGLTAPRHFFVLALVPLAVAAVLALWLAREQNSAAAIDEVP